MTKIIYKQYVHIHGDRYSEGNTVVIVALSKIDVLNVLHKQGYLLVNDDRGNTHTILTHMILVIEVFV